MSRQSIPKEAQMPPVYNKARFLVRQIMESTKKAPREIKYGYIADIVNTGLRLMEDIFKASKATKDLNRVTHIDEAISKLNDIKMKVRIIHDVNALTTKGFSAVINYEADVIYQLTSWKKSLINNNNFIIFPAEDK